MRSLLGHSVYISHRQHVDFINLESYSPEKGSARSLYLTCEYVCEVDAMGPRA